MPRINIASGETPSHTKLTTIADQSVVTASTATRLGFSGVPAGMHCYDTSLNLEFVWNGSAWKLWSGRVRAEYLIATGSPQTVASGTTADLEWLTAVDDTGSWRNGGSLPAHILYAPYDGIYAIQCSIYTTSGGVDSGYIKFVRGGSVSDYATTTLPAGTTEHHMCVTGVNLVAADTFKFQVRQTTSGSLDRAFTARLTATYMGP